MSEPALEQAPFRLGFRVCDRRFPFLWETPGQQSGRWNRGGDLPVHYLASTPLVAWAEWLRHQEIEVAEDLAGWCCVPEGRPGPELLPLVRREGMLPG